MTRNPLPLLAIGIVVATAWVAAAKAQPAADRILVNGKVLTVDADFSIAQAIAISGERILAVGTNDSVRGLAGPDTVITDLRGRTVIPGLIDNHVHYLRGVTTWPLEARLDAISSRVAALELIAAKARASEPGQWVLIIGGWNESQFADDARLFTKLVKCPVGEPVQITQAEELLVIRAIEPVRLSSRRLALYLP